MYPKILTHYGKHGNTQIFCINESREKEAWIAMFHIMDLEFSYGEYELEGDEPMAYDLAMKGDWKAARWFLALRSDGEYERTDIESVSKPRDLLEQYDLRECTKCNQWLLRDRMRSVPGCIARSILPSHICKACDPWEKKDEG